MISDARNGHVSPGIYTNERDVTYSVKSLGITSLGLVGETLYGPAFQNVEITNWAEFVDYFGGTSPIKFKDGTPKYELPYIAKSYLEESKRLNVVRVLGLSGYDAGKAWVIKNDNKPAIVLRSKMKYEGSVDFCDNNASDAANQVISSVTIVEYKSKLYTSQCVNKSDNTGTPKAEVKDEAKTEAGKFGIKVTYSEDSGKTKTYYVSLNSNDSDYIYNVLSNRPDTGTTDIYIEAIFENSLYNDDKELFIPTSKSVNEVTTWNDYKEGYKYAQTPWIVSDALISEDAEKNLTANVKKLFRFNTISDGNASNFQVKVTIQNIDVYNATFDVVVRDFNDTDRNPIILETFRKCNLVEGDANYIAYKIGTNDGGYEAKSKYILVEMADAEDLRNAFPAGFMGYPLPSALSGVDVNYNVDYSPEERASRQCFGLSHIDKDILSYKGAEYENSEVYTSGFHMDSLMESVENIVLDGANCPCKFKAVSSAKTVNAVYVPRLISGNYIENTLYRDIKTRKFTVCFYGGFDGWDVNREKRTNTNDFKATKYDIGYDYESETSKSSVFTHNVDANLNLPSTAITSDYYAYLAGVRVFANPQDVDINILATPGINWLDNALLTQEIIEVVEDSEDGRGGDALYVMASPNLADADEARDEFEGVDINSSYACTYFPWVMYYDNTNRRYLDLPVTKDIVRNMAATDNKSYPWFAPAGTERGNVNCVKAVFKTTLADEDALYEVGINPVKSFAQDGVKIWGNKTTYSVESPLNRINVRRLMIRVKKLISDAAKHLIFEQYDETLEKQFRGIVEPILADVKANRGIIDYRVITECTPETRDQHILPAKILIKPTQSLEYISISFTVYPESVSFED